MLLFLSLSPLFGALFICFFLSFRHFNLIRNFSLFFSLVIFNLSILLLFYFDTSVTFFQLIQNVKWIPFSNNFILLGIDGLSFSMILLTTFLIPIRILLCWNFKDQIIIKSYRVTFLFLDVFVYFSFSFFKFYFYQSFWSFFRYKSKLFSINFFYIFVICFFNCSILRSCA